MSTEEFFIHAWKVKPLFKMFLCFLESFSDVFVLTGPE